MSFSELMNIGLMQGFAGLSLFAVLLLMGLGPPIICRADGRHNMAPRRVHDDRAYTIYLGSHSRASTRHRSWPYYFRSP